MKPFLHAALAVALTLPAQAATFGNNAVSLTISRGDDGALVFSASGGDLSGMTLFVALGSTDFTGSLVVPHGRNYEGSTVFLPFRAGRILFSAPDAEHSLVWKSTRWDLRRPGGDAFVSSRTPQSISLEVPGALAEGPVPVTAWIKDVSANDGWGRLAGSLSMDGPTGDGEMLLRHYVTWPEEEEGPVLQVRGDTDRRKPRIYQLLPRLFGNTNETRKINGTIEENGCGKFSDVNEASIAELKEFGITHIWATGVLQQASSTGYPEIGEPADDTDLLKGLAGSPYAIRDYFDVSPDYAMDPANRLEEFRAMIERIHAAGLKVIIDFVPNHVARSYHSSVRPELSFGAEDDRSVFFDEGNNFFWLTPDARPEGSGPPLRLPNAAAAANDGLFEPEMEHGRVTGNNVISWEPDLHTWYETVKLNYGYDFTGASRTPRRYPHGDRPDLPIPDTWTKMDEVIAYWQGFGVDGFRVDMAHMVPPEFWHWLIARARVRQADVYFMAEAYDTDPAKVPGADPVLAEAGGGNVMFDLLNAGFDAVYDDDTYDRLKSIYDGGAWANDLDDVLAHPLVFENSLRYAENHDEVRLAGNGEWGGIGMEAGRPVTALLFALSRGPVMLYHGQETGEPANGTEGFGGDDARTSIFDYWSMPEFTKWVNGGKFDGGRLSPQQHALRGFYGRLLHMVDAPAFRNGGFFPLNKFNITNPEYGRLPGATASGHWVYSFLRHDADSGQTFLVVINLHPGHSFQNLEVEIPQDGRAFASIQGTPALRERLGPDAASAEWTGGRVRVKELPPLTPAFFEITTSR